ncbi:hypothetical protein GF373_00255 [bacterium]|nr:hypothetical protein [bacterium]
MARQIVFFEDKKCVNLYPLTLNRPVYNLHCGIRPLWEKVAGFYSHAPHAFHVRPYLSDLLKEQRNTPCVNANYQPEILLINGRVLWNRQLAETIQLDGDDRLFIQEDTLIAARLSGENTQKAIGGTYISPDLFPSIPKTEVQAKTINYPWDLVFSNAHQIEEDYRQLGCNAAKEGEMHEGIHILAPERVTIAPGARVKPGVVIDAEKGPVFIDAEADIYPQAVIEGPAYIGKQSWVMISAKIYEGTSIGEQCKIGGEVEECVIHSYTNKRHDGFLGHACLGEWVNLGADTNNSDLKNNYSNVKCFINGELISTESMFMGLVMGDHSKTGINTMLNTGTVAGFSCNIYGSNFPPKYLPSFAWGGSEGFVNYDLTKAIENARKCVHRKEMDISESEETVFRAIFEATQPERDRFF